MFFSKYGQATYYSKAHNKLTNFFKNRMPCKLIVTNLLLIVSWTGSVDPFTNVTDNSSYIFKKSIGNVNFR